MPHKIGNWKDAQTLLWSGWLFSVLTNSCLTDAFFQSDGRLSSPGKHLLPPTLSRSEAFLCGYGYFPFYTDLRFVLYVRLSYVLKQVDVTVPPAK